MSKSLFNKFRLFLYINDLSFITDRICGNAESRHNTTNRPQQVSVLGNTEIVQICCGSEHMVALTSQQDVYTWGCNGEGQVCCFTCNLQ